MKDERARGEVCGKPSVLLCIPPRLQPACKSYMENNPRAQTRTVCTAPQPGGNAATKLKTFKIRKKKNHHNTYHHQTGPGGRKGNQNKFR